MNSELSARRSLGEARRYREAAVTWALQEAQGTSFYDAPRNRERITNNLKAALAHELWAEYQLGRLSWDHFLIGERLLSTWEGSELSTFLATVRAVAS